MLVHQAVVSEDNRSMTEREDCNGKRDFFEHWDNELCSTISEEKRQTV